MKTSKLRGGLLVAVLAPALAVGCGKKEGGEATENQSASADRCAHELKTETCPFCTPSLIESEGFCGEHGVAEALCAQCRPYLKAAFREKGDWCEEHKVPLTQCVIHTPELADKITGDHGGDHPEDDGHDH